MDNSGEADMELKFCVKFSVPEWSCMQPEGQPFIMSVPEKLPFPNSHKSILAWVPHHLPIL